MIVEALKNFDFDNVDKVYFGFLNEHIEKYNCRYAIDMCIDELDIKDNVLIEPVTNVMPLVLSEAPKTSAELEIILLFLIAPETCAPALVLSAAPKISPELDIKEPFLIEPETPRCPLVSIP